MNRLPKVQTRIRTLKEGEFRTRCYGCYRPAENCFCDSIPQVDNQTDVLILQHQRERSHPFNTARIVKQALQKCDLVFDRNESFAGRSLSIHANAALLYPGRDSKLITEMRPDETPDQLILIDGTWDQAKSLFRDIPQLHNLPQIKLAPATPGQYRIRREPTSTSLSTIEATVQALQLLEPETEGLDRLLGAFDTMVEQQLAHPRANYDQAEPEKVNTLNIPRELLCDPSQIVVAHAEATPPQCHPRSGWSEFNRQKKQAAKLPPVFWVAQRLGGSDRPPLIQSIKPSMPIDDIHLAHMGLSRTDFESAVSVAEFRSRWSEFIRDDDLLIVANDQTLRLLGNCEARIPNWQSLKSINHEPSRKFDSLGEFLESVNAPCPVVKHSSRAGKRLAYGVSLILYLRSILDAAGS